MKYLIDTNVLLWFIEKNKLLPENIYEVIKDKNNIICFSIITFWEISIKYSLGKLKLPVPLEEFFYDVEYGFNFKKIDLNKKHILFSSKLPFLHRDPFDRLIYSVSKTENLIFLYTDEKFNYYEKNEVD